MQLFLVSSCDSLGVTFWLFLMGFESGFLTKWCNPVRSTENFGYFGLDLCQSQKVVAPWIQQIIGILGFGEGV